MVTVGPTNVGLEEEIKAKSSADVITKSVV